jgi:hypothetical protein
VALRPFLQLRESEPPSAVPTAWKTCVDPDVPDSIAGAASRNDATIAATTTIPVHTFAISVSSAMLKGLQRGRHKTTAATLTTPAAAEWASRGRGVQFDRHLENARVAHRKAAVVTGTVDVNGGAPSRDRRDGY